MGSDTMASSSREELEAAKEHFVQTVDFPNISCKIGVRLLNFKKRKSPFLTEDLVFKVCIIKNRTGSSRYYRLSF